jgi:hypothetical protein
MNLKLLVLNSLIFAMTLQAYAASSVRTEEIVTRLCPKVLCQSQWSDINRMSCNSPVTTYGPGEDLVFGSFVQGRESCLCPCNFPKFYR